MASYSEQAAGLAVTQGNAFIVNKSAAFTTASSDAPQIAEEIFYIMTNTGATTATIAPYTTTPYPVGQKLYVSQGPTGTCTITAGAGVTVTVAGGAAAVAANTTRTCIQVALNVWYLF